MQVLFVRKRFFENNSVKNNDSVNVCLRIYNFIYGLSIRQNEKDNFPIIHFRGPFFLAEIFEKVSFDPFNFRITTLSARKSEQAKNV